MEKFDRRQSAIAGKFWFSERQRSELREKGRYRTFCIINGAIMEYTELVDTERMLEEPNAICEYGDAKYLGEGFFHHHEEWSQH